MKYRINNILKMCQGISQWRWVFKGVSRVSTKEPQFTISAQMLDGFKRLLLGRESAVTCTLLVC